MHATCLELLHGHLRPGARVLDVGSGSGYLSAAMGLMVRDKGGFVLGVEKHPELVEESLANVRHATPELLDTGAVQARASGQRCRHRRAGGRRQQHSAMIAAAFLPALSPRRVCPLSPSLPVQLRAGNVLGDMLEQEEDFDAIHVGAGGEERGAVCAASRTLAAIHARVEVRCQQWPQRRARRLARIDAR